MFKQHAAKEEEAKPFVCKLCPYRTNYKGNLRKHLRTHTGERPYVCRVCGKGFTTTSNLKTHEIHRHGIQRPKRMCLSQLPSERLLATREEGSVEEELRKDGSPAESKFAAGDLHKSPASNSMLSGSSEDISDITEDRKPPLVAMDPFASEDEQKAGGSPGNYAQCSPSAGGVVFPEAVPVSAAGSNIPGSRASQRKPASPARYPLHTPAKSSASWLPGSSTRCESQPTLNLPENPFLLEPANLIHNLCASIPQLPPLYASLQALSQPRAPAPAVIDITPTARAPSGSVDELTRALLDQLVKEGRLYRCEHCNILFPEISLYIFHRGCHGQGSPFQCHFCHTVCREKFEFMAHFMYCVHSKKP